MGRGTSFMPPIGHVLQCFQKKYTSEFWSVCCNCSKMNCHHLPREKKRGRIQCSTHEIFSSWSSYNIFFKILRYTSSENTVIGGNYLFTVTVRWHHMFLVKSHLMDFPWPGWDEKLITYILEKQNKQARLLYVRLKFCE